MDEREIRAHVLDLLVEIGLIDSTHLSKVKPINAVESKQVSRLIDVLAS